MKRHDVALETLSHIAGNVTALREVQRREGEIVKPAVFEIFRTVGNVAAAVADTVAEDGDFPVVAGSGAKSSGL